MSYSGTIVPLVTPLGEHGTVQERGVTRLIESVRSGVTGLMPALSTGEGWALSTEQWTDMVGHTVRHAGGLPVLAGVELPDADAVARVARIAAELGADAVVITAPFEAADQDAVFHHFEAVREAVALPMLLYNEEVLAGTPVDLETLLRVCALPGVVGIKESSGDPELTTELAARSPVPVFEGWENLISQVRGVAGFVGPLANLDPGLCTAALANPSAENQRRVDDACARYGVLDDAWVRLVKHELYRRGIIDCPATVGA